MYMYSLVSTVKSSHINTLIMQSSVSDNNKAYNLTATNVNYYMYLQQLSLSIKKSITGLIRRTLTR